MPLISSQTTLSIAYFLMMLPTPWVLVYALGAAPLWSVGAMLAVQLTGLMIEQLVEHRIACRKEARLAALIGV